MTSFFIFGNILLHSSPFKVDWVKKLISKHHKRLFDFKPIDFRLQRVAESVRYTTSSCYTLKIYGPMVNIASVWWKHSEFDTRYDQFKEWTFLSVWVFWVPNAIVILTLIVKGMKNPRLKSSNWCHCLKILLYFFKFKLVSKYHYRYLKKSCILHPPG